MCVSVFARTLVHVHVLECLECVSLCAIEYALCRHLNIFWRIHSGAGCDMKSASSSASSSVPRWIQKSVLWHGPFTSSPACSTIYLYTLWSHAVCAGFGFLAASGFLPVTERERGSAITNLLPSHVGVVVATRHWALEDVWWMRKNTDLSVCRNHWINKNVHEMYCLSCEFMWIKHYRGKHSVFNWTTDSQVTKSSYSVLS